MKEGMRMRGNNYFNKGICIIISISLFVLLFGEGDFKNSYETVFSADEITNESLSVVSSNIYIKDVLNLNNEIQNIKNIQNREEFRENVRYVDNEIMFIRKEIRQVGYELEGLKYNDKLCKDNKLSAITVISESINSIYDEYVEMYVTYKAITNKDVWEAVDSMNKIEDIICAEPNYLYEADTYSKSNVKIASTYKESLYMEYQWYLDDLNMKNNWDNMINSGIVPGEGVTIAVIDTGIALDHSALKNALWKNKLEIAGNNIDDDRNGYVDDVNGINTVTVGAMPEDDCGHGTHVSGILAMQPKDAGVGIAYGSKLMSLKAGDGNGNFQQARIVECINYAIKNKADIINMSFAGGYSASVEIALKNAYNQDILLVAAAGNEGAPTSDGLDYLNVKANVYDNYPAGSNYVIGVMAYDRYNRLAAFSNWDYQSGKNVDYDFIAPGSLIFSTYIGDDKYQYLDGTSMATPMVTGMLACMRSIYPSKVKHTNDYLINKLRSNDYIKYRDANGLEHKFMKMNVDLKNLIANRNKIDMEACTVNFGNDYYIYDGKVKNNPVTVKFGNTTLIKGTHYTLGYNNNKNIGNATVTIASVSSGNTYGTIKKAFNIVPPKLTGVKVAAYNANAIKLKWNKGNYADGYEVLRYDQSSNTYVLINRYNSKGTLTYTNKSLKPGTTYTYKVRCFKLVNNIRICSPTVIKKSSTVPEKINLNYSTTSQSAIKLQWKKVNGANGYQIYKYNSKKKKYEKIKTVNANTTAFVNTGLKTKTGYYYTVRAYKNWGSKKIYGSFADKIKAYTGPKKVTKVTGKKYGEGKVMLRWQKSSNASGYEVLYSQTANGKYQYACRVTGSYDGMIIYNVPKGKLYYKVRAFNVRGNKRVYSGLSNAVSVTM